VYDFDAFGVGRLTRVMVNEHDVKTMDIMLGLLNACTYKMFCIHMILRKVL
jgi:hypothetical protein